MEREREREYILCTISQKKRKERKNKTRDCFHRPFLSFFVTFSPFLGGERKHSHFPKLKSEKVKILTSPSIFADVGTKITVMENILHAFSLDRTEPHFLSLKTPGVIILDMWCQYFRLELCLQHC